MTSEIDGRALKGEAFRPSVEITTTAESTFSAISATRLLLVGGISFIIAGMIFGDLFAVFVLHQNARRTGQKLLTATLAVAAHDATTVRKQFVGMGGELEDRGTKVDTHAHLTAFGYLALLLSLVQPYVAVSEHRKRTLALVFLLGAVMLPLGVFLIHYVGLSYSPFAAIGWASVVADFGGLLVLLAATGYFAGLLRYFRATNQTAPTTEWSCDRSWSRRTLLSGGTLLVLAGFVHGAWYAGFDLYRHEARETNLLTAMVDDATELSPSGATQAVSDYGALQGEKAVNIAAHAHIIEFGLLALLLSFVQRHVSLDERWRRRWVMVLLTGSVLLPLFVLLELRLGLLAGGVADAAGLLVIIALVAMMVGFVRHSALPDAAGGGS